MSTSDATSSFDDSLWILGKKWGNPSCDWMRRRCASTSFGLTMIMWFRGFRSWLRVASDTCREGEETGEGGCVVSRSRNAPPPFLHSSCVCEAAFPDHVVGFKHIQDTGRAKGRGKRGCVVSRSHNSTHAPPPPDLAIPEVTCSASHTRREDLFCSGPSSASVPKQRKPAIARSR